MSEDHHAGDHGAVGVAVLTVSTSRSLAEDAGGDAVAAAIENGGHRVAARDLVADEPEAIRERVEHFLAQSTVDAVVTTGGTGVTPDDLTVDALEPLFDRELPGFGEEFRSRSVASVGPHGMLSRATAGVVDGVAVFCLPGSEDAAQLGSEELIVPILGHLVSQAGDGSQHGDSDHSHGATDG